MSVLSLVLGGRPTPALLKSLSKACGGGVMELMSDWREGETMAAFSDHGDVEELAEDFRALLAWAEANGVAYVIHEGPVPYGPDARTGQETVTRDYALNRIATTLEILDEAWSVPD